MIREIYLDFLRDKIRRREFLWLFRQAVKYPLVFASVFFRKQLCGPLLGTLVVNYRCNYRCRMCNLPARDAQLRNRGLKELDTAGMKRLISGFARLHTAGVGFTGGEPLLREDIFELMKFTRGQGMFAHLNTNGSLLDEKAVSRIVDCGVHSVNVSLDGAREETHDSIRGFKGAFAKATEGIKLLVAVASGAKALKKARPRIKIVSVINEQNIDEAPDLIALAEALGADCIEFIPQQDFFSSQALKAPLREEAFLQKARFLSGYLRRAKRQRGVKIENSAGHLRLFERSFSGLASPMVCFAGQSSYALDCYGEAYPCVPWVNWGRSVGNCSDACTPEGFWYSPELERARKAILSCRDCYLNCQAELNLLFNITSLRP